MIDDLSRWSLCRVHLGSWIGIMDRNHGSEFGILMGQIFHKTEEVFFVEIEVTRIV